MAPKNDDYSGYSFRLTLAVILILAGISFLPRLGIGKSFLKKVNILSEIAPNDYLYEEAEEGDLYFDTTFLAQAPIVEIEPEKPEEERRRGRPQMWEAGGELIAENNAGNAVTPKRPAVGGAVVPVEDYGVETKAMKAFYDALDNKSGKKVVRIAVLGDSFIEGDILTADLREQYQDIYGGRGTGFVPFASGVAQYRGTVKHTFEKWASYNVVEKKNIPEEYLEKFYISGAIAIPSESAVSRYKGVGFRKHISSSPVARILFINEKNTTVNVTVNDTLHQTFTPDPGTDVQQIVINGNIGSLDLSINDPEGFIGYGVIFEDRKGVSVDNYSMRSNSGLGLYSTNVNINRQVDRMGGYDLVILQYGLNVMSAEQTNYSGYGKGMVNVIKYVSQSFPNASILVLGVGDRSVQRDGNFVTMPGVKGMITAQRNAAKTAGVAFWDMFMGMGGENSMVTFVEKNWAAKDYTHIGYPGGRAIAKELVKALEKDKYRMEELRAEEERLQADSLPSALIPPPVSCHDTANTRASAGNQATDGSIDAQVPNKSQGPAEKPEPDTMPAGEPAADEPAADAEIPATV